MKQTKTKKNSKQKLTKEERKRLKEIKSFMGNSRVGLSNKW